MEEINKPAVVGPGRVTDKAFVQHGPLLRFEIEEHKTALIRREGQKIPPIRRPARTEHSVGCRECRDLARLEVKNVKPILTGGPGSAKRQVAAIRGPYRIALVAALAGYQFLRRAPPDATL